jgi:hypothetical protein
MDSYNDGLGFLSLMKCVFEGRLKGDTDVMESYGINPH